MLVLLEAEEDDCVEVAEATQEEGAADGSRVKFEEVHVVSTRAALPH